MNRKIKRQLSALMLCIILTISVVGCGSSSDDTKVVLTTGFGKNEVFRIEEESCQLSEIMVYLTNIQNRYEKVYGSQIWDTQINGITLEENVKEMALAKIAQIKAMNLLAQKHNVTLNENEHKTVEMAADQYYSSLSQTEIDKIGINEDTIIKLYEEYALSVKLYRYLIKDINPEISDDEARTITVEHILVKTYTLDEDGKRVEDTDYAKSEELKRAKDIQKLAQSGEDFDSLVEKYSEDDTAIYSFGKGEMEPKFEEAAFNLGTDEISDVIETQFGYHIIKCISTFNREVTDANKIKIVEQRREEVFGDEYDSFVASLTRNLNKELWEQVTFIHDDEVVTSDFFEVFDSYFSE